MSCPENVIIQTFNVSPTASYTLIAKCSAGAMKVEEIAVQPSIDCHLQFYEGLPSGNSLGNPISLLLFVQANQLWSKPGKVVRDDIYVYIQEAGVTLTGEIRSVPLTDGQGSSAEGAEVHHG